MGESSKPGFFGRIVNDFRSTRQYLKAASSARKLAAERDALKADLASAWHEIGAKAADGGLGASLPAFASVSDSRGKSADAEAALAQQRASVQKAQELAAADAQEHERVVAAQSAEHRQLADSASAAKHQLDGAVRAVKTLDNQVADLQAKLAKLGPAGQSQEPDEKLQQSLAALEGDRRSAAARVTTLQSQAQPAQPGQPAPPPSPELQTARQGLVRLDQEIARVQAARSGIHIGRQLAELEPSRTAAREKQASAQAEQTQAASALEAKSAELTHAKEAANQARAKADKELAAAKAAESEAAKSAASATATLDEALRQFGQAVFEAGVAGPPVDELAAKARGLLDSVRAKDDAIVAAKAQADSARSGKNRFVLVAAIATVLIVALVCGILWLITMTLQLSAVKGKPADPANKKPPVALVQLDNLVSPEADGVKAVVELWLQAGIKGDAEAARKLCTPALAARVGDMQPRKIEYKIRNPIVMAQSAEVVVWAKYPDVTDDPRNEVLLTMALQRTQAGWQIAGSKTKVYFGDE